MIELFEWHLNMKRMQNSGERTWYICHHFSFYKITGRLSIFSIYIHGDSLRTASIESKKYKRKRKENEKYRKQKVLVGKL